MEEEKDIMYTIRGTRRAIKLNKRFEGSPGFAPEYYYREVGEVVFNFPHDEEHIYFQPSNNPPNVLEKEDIEYLLKVMNRKFNPE